VREMRGFIDLTESCPCREWRTTSLMRTIGSDDLLLLDSSHPHHWYYFGICVREVARPRGNRRSARNISCRSSRLAVATGMVGDRHRMGARVVAALWLESRNRSPGLRETQSGLCGLDDDIAAARARYSKLRVFRSLLSSATALLVSV